MTMLDDILDTRNRLFLADKLLYAVSSEVSPGHVLMADESAINYPYVIFHSEDEARVVAEQSGRTLVPIRDSPRKPLSHMLKGLKL